MLRDNQGSEGKDTGRGTAAVELKPGSGWARLVGRLLTAVEMEHVPEVHPRAGYFISTQDRPAFETDLTPKELDSVFDQMDADLKRWQQERDEQQPTSNGVAFRDPD